MQKLKQDQIYSRRLYVDNLDFLNIFIKENKYNNPYFLDCNYNDSVWIIKYNDNSISKIDFNVKLYNNTLLTDIENEFILNIFKNLIIENIYTNNGLEKSKSKLQDFIFSTLTIIDIILMNGLYLKLSEFGLKLVDENFIKFALNDLLKSNDKFIGAYDIGKRLYIYYKKSIKKQNIIDVNKNIYNLEEKELNEIKKLIKNKELKLSNLYPDTILKPNQINNIFNLKVYNREKENYFRNKELTNLNNNSLLEYKKVFKSLDSLSRNKKYNEYLPKNINYNCMEIISSEKEKGRFETVPSNILFRSFEKAVSFHFEYGNDIIKSFENFINNMKKENINFDNFIYGKKEKEIFYYSLTNKLRRLNVKEFKSTIKHRKDFKSLRNNEYLYDLIKAYYGAVQIVVGALIARRQSELASIEVKNCIDYENKLIKFKRSKSSKNLFGIRDSINLPIEELGLSMLSNIQKLHNVLEHDGKLFAFLNFKNPTKFNKTVDNTNYSENIDWFLDYIDLDLIEGKRPYFRQHQLRRFFAMTFFWSSGFGSMDTLRWFMGHLDVQHIYNYITESVSGEVLKSVKAEYVIDNISKYENLANLIKEKYSTSDFNLIESEDLQYYVESLIEDGNIDIEPDFFTDDSGNKYEIVLKINKSE